MIDVLNNNIHQCTKCDLYKYVSNKVTGHGPMSKVMIIGRDPAMTETEKGVPFVGRAGRLMKAYMRQLDINPSLFRMSNVIKCWPHNNGRCRPPKTHEQLSCFPWLEEEINIVQPELIIATGNVAVQNLTNKSAPNITKAHSNIYKVNILGKEYNLLAMFHPSYIIRSEQYMHPVDYNNLVRRYLNGWWKAKKLIKDLI